MRILAGVIGIVASIAGQASADLVEVYRIDDFRIGGTGNEREMSTKIIDNPLNQGFSATADGDANAYVFNAGAGVMAQSAIEWDRRDAGLDLDFGVPRVEAVGLWFLYADADFDVTVRFETFGGGEISSTATAAASDTRYLFIVPILAVADGLTGFDPTSVDRITIEFNTGTAPVRGLDFAVTSISAFIPAPASLGLLGAGALLGVRRRR